jgi:outer membrane immunogenic protein
MNNFSQILYIIPQSAGVLGQGTHQSKRRRFDKRTNRTMKKIIVAASAAIALWAAPASPSSAADMYRAPSLKDAPIVVPLFSWTGFYIGGHGGGVWSDVDFRHNGYTYYNGAYHDTLENDGFIAGGQFGYNLQSGNVVYGIEVDLGVIGLDGRKDHGYLVEAKASPSYYNRYSSSDSFYGDITGRLGYAFDRTLVYVKGGAAFIEPDFKCANNVWRYEDDDTLWGWTVGGGIEHMFRPNWSLKVEYRHFEFEDVTLTGKYGDVRFDATADAVTGGINYHFGREVEPLPVLK